MNCFRFKRRIVWQGFSWFIATVVGAGMSGVAGADSFRQRIEADWAKQDESRMIQIRQPGLVRFATGELTWEGIPDAGRDRAGGTLSVPKIAAPSLDGLLDDPCWEQAAQLPLGPIDQPVRPKLRVGCDPSYFYLGASFPTAAENCFAPPSTASDAAGGVDGVKNGRYGFHTGPELSPWWQVDLEAIRTIGKIVVYNRLDYPPGLHNVDHLVILTSDDGKQWTSRYKNPGQSFGGVTRGKPLVVGFGKDPQSDGRPALTARFVRIQLPSPLPVLFHLDEVEIYAPDDAAMKHNLALRRPANQSSRSAYSRGGELVQVGTAKIGLSGKGPSTVVTFNGKRLPANRAKLHRAKGTTTLEVALALDGNLRGFPTQITPFHSQSMRLVSAHDWQLTWPNSVKLGFGKNRLSLSVQAEKAFDPPLELSVETVVFTPQRAERQVVCRKTLKSSGDLPLEFEIAHEGAAAVVVTGRQGTTQVREGREFFVAPVDETLARAERLAGQFGVAISESAQSLRARATALDAREKSAGCDPEARKALYVEARWLGRRVAFANPRMQFGKLLLVKRFTQETYPDVCLNHMPWVSRPGGDICILSLAGPESEGEVKELLAGRLGPGHVHGADLWWDGDRVVFGYSQAKSNEPAVGWLDRASNFELRRTEEPTHIFEMNIDGSNLRQLTRGEWSDLDPTYCPNGDIVFVSERCGFSLQCNELDKDETSTNLYVMRPNGTNIRRMSVTKDGDYLPHALDDGTIGYTRWEYEQRGWAHIQSLWTIRPDGTGADALFKQHLSNPWAVEDCRSIPGSNTFVGVAAGHHTLAAGPVIIINPRDGMNSSKGIRIVTPGILPPEGIMSGSAIPQGGVMGASGFYMNPWPLSATTFLTSYGAFGHGMGGWGGQERDLKGYAIYLIDVYGTKELVYRDPNISCFQPMPLVARPKPPILPDATEPGERFAVCSLQNAAKGVPGVDPSHVKYIRIAQGVPWPYDNTYGGQRYEPDVKSVMINWNPVRVLGEVPILPDGSARFRVPVDEPVYFQLLDENHMELRRMRSFISFQPGEVRGCVGCHETREEAGAAHSMSMAMNQKPSAIVPPLWGDRTVSFLRDVQPVFDKHCAGCHGGLKPAGGLDFSGGLTTKYNRAYDTIYAKRLVSWSNVNEDAQVTKPMQFGSHKSKLVEYLRNGACSKRVQLTSEDWLRLVTWIDANAPYHDSFINKRLRHMPYDLPNDHELAEKITTVHARRCAGCHETAEVSRLDWINLAHPDQSRFLTAPLAKAASGQEKCRETIYKTIADPDYREVRRLVEAAARKAWQLPRRDLKALLPESQIGSP